MADRNGNLMPVLEDGAGYESFVQQRRAYAQALVSKWAWLLEGTKKQKLTPIDEKLYEPMAILFENQQAISAHRGVMEDQLTTDLTLPQTYALPIIRKVYPNLIAAKIASIQPMPLSSGGVTRIFFQDFQREADSSSLTTLQSMFARGSEGSVPKKVKMTITSDTVTAVKDILGATWSTEVQEDARGAMGIDVESEVIDQAANEIAREIDQQILMDILMRATAGDVDWAWTAASGYLAKEWYQTLGDSMIDAEDLIYGNRYRRADYVIAGRTVAKYIRKMQDFKSIGREPNQFALGVEHIGTVEGFWDVYTSMMIPDDRAIMGIYPRSQTDTGYIYSPYIPLAPMPLVYASYDSSTGAYKNEDKWSRNIRTRYAKKMVVPEMFATLTIAAS